MPEVKGTIGIDIGTSGARGVLVAFPSGKVQATAAASYPLIQRGNQAEHEPEDWVRAVNQILAELARSPVDVEGIALAGMMHSEVCLDADMEPVGRSILWCDGRAEAECEEILKIVGEAGLARSVGNRPFAGFTLPHLLWRKRYQPEQWGRVRMVMICKDYVRYRLTGEAFQEITDAAGMLCWNNLKGGWATAVMNSVGIDPGLMPTPCSSIDLCGRLKKEIAGATNLPEGTPVFGGAADSAAASVGLGTVLPGLAHIRMETSNIAFLCTDRPVADSQLRLHLFMHAVPARWYLMGCMLSATRALDWFLNSVLGMPLETALEQAATIPPGCEGLLFAPYLVGERTPYADSSLRALFGGISPRHTRAHFVRAVLEGTALALRETLEVARQNGVQIQSLRVTGDARRIPLWRQIAADVLQIDLVTVNTSEYGAAYGAALIAATGAGLTASIEEACERYVLEQERVKPDPAASAAYRGVYERFRNCAEASRRLR